MRSSRLAICWVTALASFTTTQATTITVQVGEGESLLYTPSTVIAAKGDTISFQFISKNHTLTQSTFNDPCTPNPAGGVDSGFFPVAADATSFPQFSIAISDSSQPLWFYCRQTGHCASGMVFAINPNATQTYAAFLDTAMGRVSNSTTSILLAPSSSQILSASPTSSGSQATVSDKQSQNTAVVSLPTAAETSPAGHRVSIHVGLIIGVVIGASALVALSALLLLFLRRRRQLPYKKGIRFSLDVAYDSVAPHPAVSEHVPAVISQPQPLTKRTPEDEPYMVTVTERLRRTKAERRQAQLRKQMAQMQQEMNELEVIANGERAGPRPGMSTAPDMAQILHQMDLMRAQIERLQGEQQSAWAQGETDEPPPGYYKGVPE